MAELANRVQETSTTTGTGTLTLAGAVTGYVTFNSAFSNGDVVFYTIDDGLGNWEIGAGTIGTGTLARTTVIESSNSNNLVPFGSGPSESFAPLLPEHSCQIRPATTEKSSLRMAHRLLGRLLLRARSLRFLSLRLTVLRVLPLVEPLHL